MIKLKGTVPLETERLILRRLTPDDAQEVFDNWASDPEVTRFLRWNTHENVEATRNWLQQEAHQYADRSFYNWGIVLKSCGTLIGSIGAVNEESEPERTELGYCIGKAYWNQGYTTEALSRIVKYLSEEAGIKRFIAKHAKENPASGVVMRHVGFYWFKEGTYKSFDGSREYESDIYHLDFD